jgi:hypothetical protein
MPIFVAALLGGLVSAAGSIVGRVLIALSIGYVSYTGLDFLMDGIRSQLLTSFADIPAQGLTLAKALRIDSIINVWLSAFAAKLTLSGIASGKLTKMVVK